MEHTAAKEIKHQLDDFHRDYLIRIIVFLTLAAWCIFVGFWYRGFSFAAFGALVGFQIICLLSYWIHRWLPSAARHGLVIGCGLWSLGLFRLLHEPLALFAMVPVGQISGVLLGPWVALSYMALMIIGALQSAHWLSPNRWMSPQFLLPPVLTVVATCLSLIWANNLSTALAWAYYSTREALNRLAEAQEHRARLHRAMKDLDEAYHRLERANRMLILARAEAEEAREARNRFALAVSHELRTPLNFILGFSELMVNSPTTYAELDQWPPGLYEDIQEIYRSSTHLLSLVNDILDLGQIEAQRMVLMKEWVDPTQLVQEVEAMVRSAFASKGLWLRTEVEPNLPQVFVDRTRIRQVLLNLVNNSWRFTEHGGVIIRVERGEEVLVFCVQDTGPGIAPEDIPKVFEEFRQVGNGSWRRREGSGLGLPISRRFVELHGGRMWVKSRVGEGASFYFALPLPEHARDLPSSSEEETSDTYYWRYLTKKAESERMLLVVSPDLGAAERITQYTEGCRVVTMRDLDQVCSKVAELLPDALILDRLMIQEDEIQSIVQKLPYDLPVISFVFPGSPGRPRHLPANVSNYLVKPIERDVLAEAVRALGPDIHDLLVVDDDPAMVRFVTLALKGEGDETSPRDGYRLITAFTGAEALERLRKDRPDAMLLDLALPGMDGWEVLEKLRQDPDLSKIPVILITAHDWPQRPDGSEEQSLQLIMRRPLSHQELTLVLRSLLGTIRPGYPAASAAPARSTNPSA